LLIIVSAASLVRCSPPGITDPFPDEAMFSSPAAEFRAHAGAHIRLVSDNEVICRERIRHYHERGFGGVFIESTRGNSGDLPEWYVNQANPFQSFQDEGMVYLDDDHMRVWRAMVEEADSLGMRVILYDDYHFPTGQVAGQFFQQFPEDMADRLDKVEADHSGPGTIRLTVPEGTFLGAALWNRDNDALEDVSDRLEGNEVACQVREGNWKLMAFYLNHEAVLNIRNPGIMNYLEKDAVANFLAINYERFYDVVGDYFGNVIPMSFYDEPSLHWLDGKMWTEDLDSIYIERYGESPIRYYPALWYDIGEETAAARNALHGIRAEMFAVNFVKQLNDWCAGHNLKLSGHMDQEEVTNPVMCNGDLMKVWEYQDIPGADDIAWWGRSNPGYKIVTSASYNYDKPVTWAETYAAYRAIDKDTVYRVAMDQYAMGINMQTPFPGRLERFMSLEELVEFNKYIGRLSYMLQGGKHVSDIAILYPIASAQATNVFGEGWEYGYTGGITAPELDYQVVGEDLFMRLRVDYTYVHPEVFDGKCLIKGNRLVLDNLMNREEYRVLILPGGNTIHTSTAEKMLEYFRQGGKIIATSMLPLYSAEFGNDEKIRSAIKEIFGISESELLDNALSNDRPMVINENTSGGKAYFLPSPDPEILGEVLDKLIPVRDVRFDEPPWDIGSWGRYRRGYKLDSPEWFNMQRPDYNGALTYTHKVKNGKDVYFFANSSGHSVETEVRLRNEKDLSVWDPHTGKSRVPSQSIDDKGDIPCTVFTLSLGPSQSLFIIGE
jgi:hypothetical protein